MCNIDKRLKRKALFSVIYIDHIQFKSREAVFLKPLLLYICESVESLYEASQSALKPGIVVHGHLVGLKKKSHH
jgi:hypothetical protein